MDKEIYEMGKEIFNYLKDNFKIYTVEECKELKDKGAYGFIYITQCKVNGKLYIGQKKFDKKLAYYLGSGSVFKKAVKKYGKDNFDRIILEVSYSQKELDSFEIKYIELFEASKKDNDLFYNIALGGGVVGLKGKDNPNYKGTVTFECGYCGKKIEKLENYKNYASNTFCSKECLRKWQSEQMKGKNSPVYKERITLQCSYCGKEIEKLESYKNQVSDTFCSRECQYKWQSEQRKGEGSPTYKGFIVIYPNGKVSEEMTGKEVANYLNVCEGTITKLAREKTCYIGKYENIRYIRVLHLEDYLEEIENKSNEEFENMCKQMVEEAKILYEEKKEELRELCKQLTGEKSYWYGKHHSEESRKKISEAQKGENNNMYGKHHSEETRKKQSEAKKKFLVCIFPSGKIIKDICVSDLAEELEISRYSISDILKSKKPYKPRNKRLKHLDGIIIMEEKDYLDMIENKNKNTNINDDKAS